MVRSDPDLTHFTDRHFGDAGRSRVSDNELGRVRHRWPALFMNVSFLRDRRNDCRLVTSLLSC